MAPRRAPADLAMVDFREGLSCVRDCAAGVQTADVQDVRIVHLLRRAGRRIPALRRLVPVARTAQRHDDITSRTRALLTPGRRSTPPSLALQNPQRPLPRGQQPVPVTDAFRGAWTICAGVADETARLLRHVRQPTCVRRS